MKKQSEPEPEHLRDADEQEAFLEFVDEFGSESDRAAVILGAAKLDFLLLQVIRKFLLPSVSNNDELLEGDSGLSTFSARIHFCYRAGLIDAEFARALHLIRKIRNSFAHEVAGGKLSSSPHRDRIRELAAPFSPVEEFEGFTEAFFAEKSAEAAGFFSVLGIMVIRLEGLFNDLVPLDRSQEVKLIPPELLEGGRIVEVEEVRQKRPRPKQLSKARNS